MTSYGNSLVDCGRAGFGLYGEGSYTILETLVFDTGGDGLRLGNTTSFFAKNGIVNLELSTVMRAGAYGMTFEAAAAWNVEVASSLFADSEDAAFALGGDNNLLTLIDTCYDGIVRDGQNAFESSINSVDTTDYGDNKLCSKAGVTRPALLKKLSDLLESMRSPPV
jgi:hypothetical protein